MTVLQRIGHGYDVHAFDDGGQGGVCSIILGGVSIPYNRSLKAHSDGDVVLHALCDALLGAAALGDIGQHFPDTDPRFANADSRKLLRHVLALLREQQFFVHNIDVTIIAQAPRMAEHIQAMQRNIAEDLSIKQSNVNVKATTTERLGYIGREEGIAVHAVALICGEGG